MRSVVAKASRSDFKTAASGGEDDVQHLPLRTKDDTLQVVTLLLRELRRRLGRWEAACRPVIEVLPRAVLTTRLCPKHCLRVAARVNPVRKQTRGAFYSDLSHAEWSMERS